MEIPLVFKHTSGKFYLMTYNYSHGNGVGKKILVQEFNSLHEITDQNDWTGYGLVSNLDMAFEDEGAGVSLENLMEKTGKIYFSNQGDGFDETVCGLSFVPGIRYIRIGTGNGYGMLDIDITELRKDPKRMLLHGTIKSRAYGAAFLDSNAPAKEDYYIKAAD